MAQDYIMRMVEQIAAMLAAIIAKRRLGQTEEAKADLAALSLQTIGLPLDTVRQLAPDALASHLAASGGNRYSRSVMLAELLIQDAEMLDGDAQAETALRSRLHAFCLLFDAFPVLSREEQSIFRPKLEMLAAKLERLPPNPFTTEKLRALQTVFDSALR
jgi:hypothetical protein